MNKIDVCIPTYNREDLVSQLISSIPEYWSVNISDNGNFFRNSGKCKFPNVILEGSDSILDVFSNWRRAGEMGNAEWFLFPSDDDLYYDNVEREITKALVSSPSVGMVVFGHDEIDADSNIIRTWMPNHTGVLSPQKAFEVFSKGVPARMPSILFNREAYKSCGGVNPVFRLTAGDSELIQRMAIRFPVKFAPSVISGYRVWEGGLTHKKIATAQWQDEIDLWMKLLADNLASAHWNTGRITIRKIQDEIRLQNLLAGMANIKSKFDKLKFLRQKPYPAFATLHSHLRVIRQLSLPSFR
jgi:hypothetical protein